MEFLPKTNANHVRGVRPKAASIRDGNSIDIHSDTSSVEALVQHATSLRSSWLTFSPSLLLIIALIAAFRVGSLEGKNCSFAIGWILIFHNGGAVVQRLIDQLAPRFSSKSHLVRGAFPLTVMAGLVVWLLPSVASGFYEESLKISTVVAALLFASYLTTTWLAGRLGGSWTTALRVTCCIYLAVLYVGSLVTKTPALAISFETSLMLIIAGAFVLHLLSEDVTMMPIQVFSVTYTMALWDSYADAQRMANTLTVSFALLAILMAFTVSLTGFLRAAKR